jgi:RimJ/RimL family protein N-acetyltransferase
MVEIKLEKGIIREIRKSDISKLVEASKDQDTLNYYFCGANSIEKYWKKLIKNNNEVRNIVCTRLRTLYHLIFEINHDVAGYIGAQILDDTKNGVRYDASINYFVNKDYRNMGVGSEMVGSFTSFLSRNPNIATINAHCLPENKNSQNVLLKNGFEDNGLIFLLKSRKDVKLFSYKILKN